MRKVIVVDDVPSSAFLLKCYAEKLPDVDVETFTSSIDALSWCRGNELDLVILDYMMPEMDGAEFLREFRRSDRLQDVPVVMITGAQDKGVLYQALDLGANDFLRKPVDDLELCARARNMLYLRGRQVELSAANQRLYEQATTDCLTGLPNRRFFLQNLQFDINRSRRYRRPCTLAMIDADRFKTINDCYGHDAGDRVLAHLSGLLRSSMRDIDMVGRVGGEEFAIRLPETDLDGGMLAVTRIVSRVREARVDLGEKQIGYTISAGLTALNPDDDDMDSFLKRADKALYRAKSNGRDRVEMV